MKINRSFQIRSIDEESRIIEGQAIVFDSWSRDLGGFIEKIEPTAISEEELCNFDIICNYNHDDNQMLARYHKGEGTLSLELKPDGLYFQFECPETAFGDEILYHVRHNNISECSFAALISRNNVTRDKEGDHYIQIIKKIDQILDVSLVNRAAYPATSVSARSEEEATAEFEDIKREVDEKEAVERAEQERIEQEKRNEEILNGLEELKNSFLEEIK